MVVTDMKKIVLTILIISLIFLLSGCTSPQEEENPMLIDLRQYNFANAMLFNYYLPVPFGRSEWDDGEWFGIRSPLFPIEIAVRDAGYTTLIFVHARDDKHGHPDEYIVAWPTRATQFVVDGINKYIIDNGVELAQFSLAYPIIVENLVDDWENVNELWLSFDNVRRSSITGFASSMSFRMQQRAWELRENAPEALEENGYEEGATEAAE